MTTADDGTGLVTVSRGSSAPWISSVWQSRSDDPGSMTSVASETWGLVFWHHGGVASAAVTGPESRSSQAPVPAGARFTGIQFAVGTSLRMAPTSALVDAGVDLPDTTDRRFWLDGRRWEAPTPEDAEALVERLVRDGALVRDPAVAATLAGSVPNMSERTLERRFRAATGLSRGAIAQIERVRVAAERLSAGDPPALVVHDLGYYDEPHLARALRRLVGRTAGQLRGGAGGAIALPSADDVVDDLDHAVAVSLRRAELQRG